jgi:hypothetical protein
MMLSVTSPIRKLFQPHTCRERVYPDLLLA